MSARTVVTSVAARPLTAIAGLLFAVPVAAQAPSVQIRAENTLAFVRTDETLALKWADVVAKLPIGVADEGARRRPRVGQ